MGNVPSSTPTNSPSSSTSFECVICTETVPGDKRFNNNKDKCSHPFCVDCIAHHIQVKVEDDKVGDIKCPDIQCGSSLDPLTCRPIVTPNVFETWCDVLCESMLVMSEKSFYCPFTNCSALFLNECGGNVKKSECPTCKKLFCFQCRLPWHSGFGCNESQRNRDRNDVLFGELVEMEKWGRCPVCKHFVELISGCYLVTCRCGMNFCYVCGRKAEHGHICIRTRAPAHTRARLGMDLLLVCVLVIIMIAFTVFVINKFYKDVDDAEDL